MKGGKGNDRVNGGPEFAFLPTGEKNSLNGGQGDDTLVGSTSADKFKCGSGQDTVTDFNEAEGDKASGNCENV